MMIRADPQTELVGEVRQKLILVQNWLRELEDEGGN